MGKNSSARCELSQQGRPNIAISAFFDRLVAKGGSASPDICKSIFGYSSD
jgi:hypothetical protein